MSFKLGSNAAYLAWADTKARYKKSVLGPFWIVLTNSIGVVGLSIIWSALFNQSLQDFAPTLCIGLIVWQLVSSVLNDAPGAFTRESRIIRNVNMPAWFFAVRLLARHVITFAHNLIIVAGVIWWFDLPLGWGLLQALLAVLLVVANLFCIIYLLGLLGARFRDVELAVHSVLPLLFFISPVMFKADKLPQAQLLIWSNPFSYFIEAIRAPLLGHEAHAHTLLVLLLMLAVGTVLCAVLMRGVGRRIAFWV